MIKATLVLMGALVAGMPSLRAQSCDTLIAEGRNLLSNTNLLAANARFAQAVALCPNHATGNVLYAFTRLFALPNDPVGSNFLTRLGFPVPGRHLYEWTARPPQDTNGLLLAPAGVNAAESAAVIRTNILPALIAAEANLAKVTNTNFVLTLLPDETRVNWITVDYGDILVLRSILQFLQYLCYTINSWNLDVQLSALRALETNDMLSIERVLNDRPELLTFSNTNDLAAARTAFLNLVDRYVEGSMFIRSRPANVVRLFNYDLEEARGEEQFRCVLASLKNSLTNPIVFCTDSNLTVHFARHFTGENSWRSLLPEFGGNKVILGTLPDPSFGGIVTGLSYADAEEPFIRIFDSGSRVEELEVTSAEFIGHFATRPGRIYAVEYSTNFVDWIEIAEFFADGGTYDFVDTERTGSAYRFYRLVDRSHFITVAGRVLNQCSLQLVQSATVSLGTESVTTGADGRFSFRSRPIDPPWDAFVEADAAGFDTAVEYFWGDESESDLAIYLKPDSSSAPPNNSFANRRTITGVPAMVSGSTCGATLEPGEPTSGYIRGKSVWWTWTAPFSGRVRIIFEPGFYSPVFDVHTGASLGTLQYVDSGYSHDGFEAVAGRTYQIAVGVDEFNFDSDRGFVMKLSMPPVLMVNSPADGAEFTAPATILFDVTVSDPDGNIREVRYDANDLIAVVTNSPYDFTWSNVPPDEYYVDVEAVDNQGNVAWDFRMITVRPSNDNFANRTLISGTAVTLRGSNRSATSEPNEPDHGGMPALNSVWWRWIAPAHGGITIQATSGDGFGSGDAEILAVYSGATLSSLTPIAEDILHGLEFGTQVSFQAVAGTEYSIVVDGYDGDEMTLRLWPTRAPVVQITAPADGATFAAPANVTISATANDLDGGIARVDFFVNGKRIGSDTTVPYQAAWNEIPQDYYEIHARAIDNTGVGTVSMPITVRVLGVGPLGSTR